MKTTYKEHGKELTVKEMRVERHETSVLDQLLFGKFPYYEAVIETDRGEFRGTGETKDQAIRKAKEEVRRRTGIRID